MIEGRSSFFNAFNLEFERQLPQHENYRAAFNAAASTFEQTVGISPYRSYESFKVQRSKRRRR